MAQTSGIDRFKAAFLGFAIGDALGMPAQFLTPDQIRKYYGGKIRDFVAAHPGHASDFLPAGAFTDETQLMLATAECLVECGKADPARQADALLAWYTDTSPHRTPMRANMRACKRLAHGRPWNRSGVLSSGCGAALRMPPVGLFLHQEPDLLVRAALEIAAITHAETRAKGAAVAVACLVARLLQRAEHSLPGDQVLETADRVQPLDADTAAMLRWITQIVHLPADEALFEIGTSADAIEAVPAAVYCFLKHPSNFSAAVLDAVNAGDASDSIGALAGCLVGCWSGMQAIPEPWREAVESGDLLIGVAQNLLRATADRAPSRSIRTR